MSTIRVAPSTSVSHASLSDLFTGSPALPPTPKSPRSDTSDVKIVENTQRSETAHTPPPEPSTSWLNPINRAGQPASSTQHRRLILRVGSGASNKSSEEDWALERVKNVGKARLREIKCCWTSNDFLGPSSSKATLTQPCDAVLASYNLFRKHIKRHIVNAETNIALSVDRIRPPAPGVLDELQCGWSECSFSASNKVEYERHVQGHVQTLQETFCPFKDCPYPELTPEPYGSLYHYDETSHPHPWNEKSLRPNPASRPLRPTLTTPPPLPKMTTIGPFLANVSAFAGRQPKLPDPNVALRRSHRASRHGSPGSDNLASRPLAQVKSIIGPRDRSDDYFVPIGEEIPSGLTWTSTMSSSIFPVQAVHDPANPQDYNPIGVTLETPRGWEEPEIDLKTMMRAEKHVDGGPLTPLWISPLIEISPPGPSEPSVRPLTVQRRLKRPQEELVPSYAFLQDVYLRKPPQKRQRTHRDTEKKVVPSSAQGREASEATGGSSAEEKRFDPTRIARAARLYATRKAGRSYGLEVQLRQHAFHRRGKVLGEM